MAPSHREFAIKHGRRFLASPMALPLLFSSSTRVVGAAVDVVVVNVVGERWYSSIFLCLAWLPYSYSTHTTRQHSLRSALAV